jgi:hypothetical protein
VAKLDQIIRMVLGSILTLGVIASLSVVPELGDGVIKIAAMPSPSVLSFVLFGVGALLLRGFIGTQSVNEDDC